MRLRIVPVNWHPRYHYAIAGLKVNGKRRRLFFETAREANEELGRLKTKARQQGQAGLDMPDALRAMAAGCAHQLKPYGKTLHDATSFYLKHLAASESPNVGTLIESYIHSQERGGLSARHLRDVRNRLTRFKADFGGRPCRTVAAAELEEWLFGLHNGGNPAPQTVKNWRATVRAFFGWALRQRAVDTNPVDAVARPKVARGAPAIWAPAALGKLLRAAPPALAAPLVTQAFCGLRTAEVLRLNWREVNLANGLVEVTAGKSKGAGRRLVKIEPNAAQWLALHAGNAAGPVWAGTWRGYHTAAKRLARSLGFAWVPNGLRHSYASYHLGHFGDAGRLAHEMGHANTAMIYQHYRELVPPAAAARYWETVP
jgi:integrase